MNPPIVLVLLHSIAIVNPDEREVLDVMEDFEERDSGENVCDAVIAEPPKTDAVTSNASFTGFGRFPFAHIQAKFARNKMDTAIAANDHLRCTSCKTQGANRVRRSRSKCVERIGHSCRRKQHSRRKPDSAGCEIEPAGERGEGSRFRVVNATKTIGLHHAVPDAPEENDKDHALHVPPGE